MCRLIYYELAKIWRKRSLALSVCVLLILNLFLLWYVNCSNGENVPLSAYKSFQNEIAEMSEIEKGGLYFQSERDDGWCLLSSECLGYAENAGRKRKGACRTGDDSESGSF